MLRPLVIFIIALTVFLNNGHAQRLTKNDSLRNNISKAATDSLKVEALYEYMKANLNNNTSDFGPYLKQMTSLSRKINFKWGLSTAYILSLSYYKNHGEFERALKYADSATTVTKGDTAKKMRINMGHISLNRGNLYYNIGDNENALKDYFKAEKIFNQEHHRLLATAYGNISNCFMALNDFRKGITYAQLAVNAAKQFNDQRLLATDMMNLATAFMNAENYKAADSLMHIIGPIVSTLQNSKSFHAYYYNKGYLEASYRKDTLKALTYYHQSYEYALKNEDVWQLGRSLDFIVYYQLALKQKEAKGNIDKLYQLAKENDQKDTEASALDYYSKWYSRLGDYKKAYEYQRQYHAVADSLQSDNIKEKAAMMDVRFRVANKEQEISQLKDTQKIQQLTIRQKNIIAYCLIGSTLALLAISLLSYRNYKHRQTLQDAKIDELETEKQLTATEAVLKGEEQERTRLAKDLHDGLGGMLSGIKFSLGNMKGNLILTPENAQAFERSMNMLDSSIKEMRRVAHNVMPEVLVKYGLDTALKEFCNEIDRSKVLDVNYQSVGMDKTAIEQTMAVTIYRIVQELVNNAIKHAAAKNVLVQAHLSEQEKLLNITVEDDGKGFDRTTLRHAEGIGWQNIQNRVEFLKGTTDIQSSPGKGTSVMIEIGI